MAEETEIKAESEAPTQEAEPKLPVVSAADSATFSRCAGCRHAKEVDISGGTLACGKHNMLINAEADEIPDDCAEHAPSDAVSA